MPVFKACLVIYNSSIAALRHKASSCSFFLSIMFSYYSLKWLVVNAYSDVSKISETPQNTVEGAISSAHESSWCQR